MKVRVRYFASIREALGSGEVVEIIERVNDGDVDARAGTTAATTAVNAAANIAVNAVRKAASATVGSVRDSLISRGGAHAEALARGRSLRCARNQTVCDEGEPLKDGDELAFFPPVTGG